MHEISLVQNLIHQLHELAERNKCQRIIEVFVEIGPCAGVVVDSFQFAYETMAAEDELTKKSRLTIDSPANSSELTLQKIIME